MPRRRCVMERNGVWHVVAGPTVGEGDWTPIKCGLGINLHGHVEAREPTCSECLSAIRRKRRGSESA